MCTKCISICDQIILLQKEIESTSNQITCTVKLIEQISDSSIDQASKTQLIEILNSFIQTLTTVIATMRGSYFAYVEKIQICEDCHTSCFLKDKCELNIDTSSDSSFSDCNKKHVKNHKNKVVISKDKKRFKN